MMLLIKQEIFNKDEEINTLLLGFINTIVTDNDSLKVSIEKHGKLQIILKRISELVPFMNQE